jgi:hypothetical protein
MSAKMAIHMVALPNTASMAGVNYLGRSTTTILAGQARGSCR